MRRVMRGHKMESSTLAQPYGQAHCMAHCTAMYIAPVHTVEDVSIQNILLRQCSDDGIVHAYHFLTLKSQYQVVTAFSILTAQSLGGGAIHKW